MRIIDDKEAKLDFSIAVIVSRFNEEITGALLQGALGRLKELNFSDNHITVVWVPGAVEIPLTAQRLAQMGTFEAIVCLGAVIKGDTDHYQFVCDQVSQGCQQVALENNIPVLFGVLTTADETQAKDRAGGKDGNKGRDAVDAAVSMVSVFRQIG
jgi:6,7-dimethyl-8-ribityllumazine synthase